MKTILEITAGSTLTGTEVPGGVSDLDIMAVGIESTKDFIGFSPNDCIVTRTQPEGVKSGPGDTDYVCYGLKKYLSLVLKGNPTLLMALFAPKDMIRVRTNLGDELQALAPKIVSKQVQGPFLGYMKEQTERLKGERGQKNIVRPELVEKYGFDTKYAAHIVRLGVQGEEILRTGRLQLPMLKRDKDLVVAIRKGVYPLAQVYKLIEQLENDLKQAYNSSSLPDEPDRAFVQAWMIETYMKNWNNDG